MPADSIDVAPTQSLFGRSGRWRDRRHGRAAKVLGRPSAFRSSGGIVGHLDGSALLCISYRDWFFERHLLFLSRFFGRHSCRNEFIDWGRMGGHTRGSGTSRVSTWAAREIARDPAVTSIFDALNVDVVSTTDGILVAVEHPGLHLDRAGAELRSERDRFAG